MNIYTGMLFQHGFIQDAQLALSLGRGESGDSSPASPEASRSRMGNDASPPCKPMRRGAIAAVCSIALSPFR